MASNICKSFLVLSSILIFWHVKGGGYSWIRLIGSQTLQQVVHPLPYKAHMLISKELYTIQILNIVAEEKFW